MVADRFRLRYKLTRQHYQTYLKLAGKRARGRGSWKNVFVMFFFGLLSGIVLIYLNKNGFVTRHDISVFLIGAGIAALAIGLLSILANKRMVGNIVGAHDAMLGNFTLTAYEGGGIQITGKHMQSSFDWTAFIDLTQVPDLVVLWIDKGAGVLLPNDAFSDDDEKAAFIDFVKERIEATRATA